MHTTARVVLLMCSAWVAGSGCSTGGRSPASTDGAGAGAGGAAGTSGGGGTAGASGAAGAGHGGVSGGGTGGASGSAGAGDGGADAGLDGGADTNADPCDSALFCESFESYAAGTPPGGDWATRTNHGAVSVVEDQKFGGTRSARFTTEANSGGKTAFIHLDAAAVFPVSGNRYFGRMMVRLEAAPETSVHWTLLESTGTVPGQSYRATYRYGGQHPVTEGSSFVGSQLMANYETPDSYSGNGPSSDCWLHADKKVLPVGRWACVEWQFDGPNDTMRFWLDGQALEDLTMAGQGQGCVHQSATFPWTAPTFGDLDLGWESYQDDAARTLYVDDVVIHTEKIGCPDPQP